jgi:uncharacterized protein (UPF0248 family)
LTSPRDVLNWLKWHERALAEAQIAYVHRGAPNDTRVVSGAEVRDVGSWAFVLGEGAREATIPYHRVLRISRGGEVLWERRKPDAPDDGR